MPRAVALYARRRRSVQRTRLILARAMYDIFCAQTPELRLLRDGMRHFWNGGSKRCESSMALLSTAEGRLRFLLLHLVQVTLCGLRARAWDTGGRRRFPPPETRMLLGLSRLVLRHAGEAFRTT
jgi:hypothetical protein